MPAPRIDWQQIKRTIEASPYQGGEPFLFIVPHFGRHLLLSLADRLEWEATYRDFGYDFSDWDYLQTIVAETHSGLMAMEQVNLIVAKLEEIRAEIALLRESGGDTLMGELVEAVGLLDPRLGTLIAVVDSIENVLGGTNDDIS